MRSSAPFFKLSVWADLSQNNLSKKNMFFCLVTKSVRNSQIFRFYICFLKLLFLKRCVHALGKNLKLFHWVLLCNVKFFLLNDLTNKRKGILNLFCTLPLFVKSFSKENFTLMKSTQLKNFISACTHLSKNNNLRQQGLQIAAFQQRYSTW